VGLDSPNGGELRFIGRQVSPPPTASYSLAMANDEVERIGQYYDLDLRPLVSTPQVAIPAKPRDAQTSLPGVRDVGETSPIDGPPPMIRGGF
jgi:hypothetical protein